jgi:ankyrin repeat protein
LAQGCGDIDHKDCKGRTALGHAVRCGHTEATRLCLEAGADPTIPSHNGLLPKRAALLRGAWSCIDLLEVREARWQRLECHRDVVGLHR